MKRLIKAIGVAGAILLGTLLPAFAYYEWTMPTGEKITGAIALFLNASGKGVAASVSAPLPARSPSIAPVASTAIESNHVFCAGPCSLVSATLTSGAAAGFWMVFDATSAPADGAVTPKYCWQWSANTSGSYAWSSPAQLLNGGVFVFSTGANCVTKAASATAFFTAQVSP